MPDTSASCTTPGAPRRHTLADSLRTEFHKIANKIRLDNMARTKNAAKKHTPVKDDLVDPIPQSSKSSPLISVTSWENWVEAMTNNGEIPRGYAGKWQEAVDPTESRSWHLGVESLVSAIFGLLPPYLDE
jgi:hypothetical protein